jgi:hypothetical protein
MKKLADKENLLSRLAAFKKFNDWEKDQACSMDASEALAAIGSLYNLIPPEARNSSPDLRGIKAMQSALSHI